MLIARTPFVWTKNTNCITAKRSKAKSKMTYFIYSHFITEKFSNRIQKQDLVHPCYLSAREKYDSVKFNL